MTVCQHECELTITGKTPREVEQIIYGLVKDAGITYDTLGQRTTPDKTTVQIMAYCGYETKGGRVVYNGCLRKKLAGVRTGIEVKPGNSTDCLKENPRV